MKISLSPGSIDLLLIVQDGFHNLGSAIMADQQNWLGAENSWGQRGHAQLMHVLVRYNVRMTWTPAVHLTTAAQKLLLIPTDEYFAGMR